MKIVPIEVDSERIYEHRHLFTDDVQYNSLIISNLFNKQIKLFDYDSYKKHKNIVISISNNIYKYILSKNGVYELYNSRYNSNDEYYLYGNYTHLNWQYYQETFSDEYDKRWYSHLILTIV